jgi:hypothetical protein
VELEFGTPAVRFSGKDLWKPGFLDWISGRRVSRMDAWSWKMDPLKSGPRFTISMNVSRLGRISRQSSFFSGTTHPLALHRLLGGTLDQQNKHVLKTTHSLLPRNAVWPEPSLDKTTSLDRTSVGNSAGV